MTESILHITNGDCAVTALQNAGVEGTFLPWRDVLHIGPVPDTENWQQLDDLRTEYLSSLNLAPVDQIKQGFSARSKIMANLDHYQRIYLWFEHDLYDQLQLMQILVWLSSAPVNFKHIQLVVTDLFIGPASAGEVQELFRFSEPLQAVHTEHASACWAAFTAQEPTALANIKTNEVLPFMAAACQRMCREYPAESNGLSLVQHTVLGLLSSATTPSDLFTRYQTTEEAAFLGDAIFKQILMEMMVGDGPLLEIDGNDETSFWQQKLKITPMGRQVWQHDVHYASVKSFDQWYGGVHNLKDQFWCYDKTTQNFNLWSNA